MVKRKTYPAIKPFYIKNEKEKTTHVYLDLKTYKSILTKLKELEKIKKHITKSK